MTPTPRTQPTAVGLGEVLWDLLPASKQLGGAPANFSYHAQQLGAKSAVVSAVGRDALGDEIVARLRDLGIDTQYVAVDPQHATGTVSVNLDSAGVPSYVIHENVAWDFLQFDDALRDLGGKADVVCFGTLAQRNSQSHDCIRDMLSRTRALKILDINLRQHYYSRSIIQESLGRADVLKINDEEVGVVAKLFGLTGSADLMRMLFDTFALQLIALTRGGKGSVLYPRDGEPVEHPGARVMKLADTVGAGDSFTAALAIGMLRGETLDRINDAANRLAAYVCSMPGATPPIPAELVASLWK